MNIPEIIVKGKIHSIDNTENVSKKADPFLVRKMILDCTEKINGSEYPNYLSIQFNQKKCELLNDINIGDEVEVNIGIKGGLSKKEGFAPQPKNPNADVSWPNINGFDITVLKRKAVIEHQAAQTQNNQASNIQEMHQSPDGTTTGTKDDLPF